MRRRLSSRAFAITAAGGLLFLAGTTAQAGWLFVLAAGVIGLVVGSVLVRQNLNAASVERSTPARTRVGDQVRVGVTLFNTGKRRLPMLRVVDRFDAFDEIAASSDRLGPGESARIEQVRTALRRGRFESGAVTIRAGSPFGFMSTTRTLQVSSPVVVVPRWAELSSFPILEPSSIPFDVLHERARTGAGEEYMGVREYRPGDPRRAVHWRSTARAGHLVVREFEEEVASKVALVLAGSDTGVPPESAFESLVSATATVAIYAMQTGHPVEVSRYDEDGSPIHIDGPDRYSVLDWLAGAAPGEGSIERLASGALTRIGRRGTVVIFAPTTGVTAAEVPHAVRAVQNAGSRVIVVAARASSWQDKGSADATERELMAEFSKGRASVRFLTRDGDLARELMTLGAPG